MWLRKKITTLFFFFCSSYNSGHSCDIYLEENGSLGKVFILLIVTPMRVIIFSKQSHALKVSWQKTLGTPAGQSVCLLESLSRPVNGREGGREGGKETPLLNPCVQILHRLHLYQKIFIIFPKYNHYPFSLIMVKCASHKFHPLKFFFFLFFFFQYWG